MKRILIGAAAIFIIVVLPPYLRTLYEARSYVLRAETTPTVEEKLTLYLSAVRWRSPLNTYSQKAEEQVLSIAERADDREKLETLLRLRSGYMATRTFLHPGPPLELDRKIQELNPRALTPRFIDRREPTHSFMLQTAVQIFFWSWIGLIVSGIWRGFDREGGVTGSFQKHALGGTIAFICWAALLCL